MAVAGCEGEVKGQGLKRSSIGTVGELLGFFEELVAKVDAVGQARCEQGRKRYARLVAKARAGGASRRSRQGG
jgi:hypothetical protein